MVDEWIVPAELRESVARVEASTETVQRRQSRDEPTQYYLEGWQRLINEIGEYPGSLADEYLNELAVRSVLRDLLLTARRLEEWRVLEWLLPLVDGLDGQFRAKSELDVEQLIWSVQRFDTDLWWERRMPSDQGLIDNFRVLSPEMKRSLP